MSATEEKHVQMWPSHIAHHVTECIFRDVRAAVLESRLNRHGVALVQREELKHIKSLGQGAFSQVRLVDYQGHAFAMKHLRQDLLNRPSEFRQAAVELAVEGHMLASLSHPNLIQLHGWTANGVASFAQGYHDSFFLLLDPLEETLENRIQSWKRVQENGVIYRDLKPNNVGFRGGRAILFDMGLSRELPQLDTRLPFHMSGSVGTLRYMSPQVAAHQPYNVSADAYSWAMVCFEILTLEKPYDRFSRDMHATLVCRKGVRPEWPRMSQEYWHLQAIVTSAWNQIPHARPCMATICHQLALEQERLFVWLNSEDEVINDSLYRKAPMRNSSDSTNITVMSAESGIYSAF